MRFSFVILRDFRNYRYLELQIPPGASLFMGQNAQGKTNLLEACYYVSSLSSPRAEKESDLVRWGEKSFSLAARLEDNSAVTTVKIDTIAIPSVRRKLQINDRHARRQDILTLFPCVYFSPDDLDIVKGSSGVRRKFIDSILSRQDTVYARVLSRYNDTVSRRNMILKKVGFDSSWARTLEALDQLVVKLGSELLYKRLLLIEDLSGFTRSVYRFIAGNDCVVTYQPTVGTIPPDLETIRLKFRSKLKQVKEDEIARGMTLIGPHRDEMVISFNDKAFKTFRYFGSQGQQRSMVLALKMAEARCLERSFKTKPIILLDDVFSELDSDKRSKVLSLCDFGYQVLMTSTELPKDTGPKFSLFEVKDNGVHLLPNRQIRKEGWV